LPAAGIRRVLGAGEHQQRVAVGVAFAAAAAADAAAAPVRFSTVMRWPPILEAASA